MSRNALRELDFDGVTSKRATWEAFDFAVPTDGTVVVRNESYGIEADDHTHAVTVTDGVPTACTCKADEFGDGACKHRVAVALAKPVLEAASVDREKKKALADGGVTVETRGSEAEENPLPEITTHVEPPEQGGAAYIRCEGCGREVIGTDERRLTHREECAHSRDNR